nr:12995_t:CDS:2 [Entrophospora candida]
MWPGTYGKLAVMINENERNSGASYARHGFSVEVFDDVTSFNLSFSVEASSEQDKNRGPFTNDRDYEWKFTGHMKKHFGLDIIDTGIKLISEESKSRCFASPPSTIAVLISLEWYNTVINQSNKVSTDLSLSKLYNLFLYLEEDIMAIQEELGIVGYTNQEIAEHISKKDNIAPVIELMAEPVSKSHMKKLTISGMINGKDTKGIYDSGGQCSNITYEKVKELSLVTDTDRIVSNITDQL